MRQILPVRLIQAIFAILCITSFIYLFLSRDSITRFTKSHWSPTLLRPTTASNNNNNAHLNRVREFWLPFEQAIRDAAPQAPAVRFAHGYAAAEGVTANDDKERAPTRNLVSNPEIVDELARAHASFRSFLDSRFDGAGQLGIEKGSEGVFSGQGVVMVAGGEYFGPAIVGIQMLRRTGCTLPVEAFVADAAEYESEVCETILPASGARCVILTDVVDTSERSGLDITHFQLKALAILFSSFNHVLYLDSDSVPLVEPSGELFAKEPYLSKGLVNWPDFWHATESPLFYRIAGLSAFPPGLPASSTEAGQLLVDKSRHIKTLLLSVYYNIYGPKWYYPLLSQGVIGQGDKNTWESAAIVLGLPWYRVQTGVGMVGRVDAGDFKGSAMVQYHPGDDALKRYDDHRNDLAGDETSVRPAFIHANTPKLNAGHLVDEGDLQDKETHERLRLWGSAEDQIKRFGYDVEKEAFKHVVESGCKWGSVLNDWKKRTDLCRRLQEHYRNTFHVVLYENGGGNGTFGIT